MEKTGRHNWGAPVRTAREIADRGYDRLTRTDFIQPIVGEIVDTVLTGSRPIARALYGEADSGPVVGVAELLIDKRTVDEYGFPDVPSVSPVKPAAPSARAFKRERVAGRRRFKRAARVYGKGYYLSKAHMRWLVVLWTGSCLLVSSAITLLWLTLIERLGLS